MSVDTDLMEQQLEALIMGRVQGVGFRYFVRTAARRLGVTGWVCNTRDGCVRVVAEGSSKCLKQLVEALEHGPSLAGVEGVRCRWDKPSGAFSDFSIRV
jgi:acylphosphatase